MIASGASLEKLMRLPQLKAVQKSAGTSFLLNRLSADLKLSSGPFTVFLNSPFLERSKMPNFLPRP